MPLLPVGNFIRIEATLPEVDVLGNKIGGTFFFEQVEEIVSDNITIEGDVTLDSEKYVKVGVRGLAMSLGDSAGIKIQNGDGYFVLKTQDKATELNGVYGVRVDLPDFSNSLEQWTVDIEGQSVSANGSIESDLINNLIDKISSIKGTGLELYMASRVSDTEGVYDFTSNSSAVVAGEEWSLTVGSKTVNYTVGSGDGLVNVVNGLVSAWASLNDRGGYTVTQNTDSDNALLSKITVERDASDKSGVVRFGVTDNGVSLYTANSVGDYLEVRRTSDSSNEVDSSLPFNLKISSSVNNRIAVVEPLNTLSVKETTFAGSASGSVNVFGVSGFDLVGNFSLSVNSGQYAVEESFDFGGDKYNLVLPSGPYVKISATQASLSIGGQSIGGDFVFEKTSVTDKSGSTTNEIVAAVSNMSVEFGDGTSQLLGINDGKGAILIDDGGIAAVFEGNLSNNVPGMAFKGALELEINTMESAISDRVIEISTSKSYTLNLPAAVSASDPYFAIVGKGVASDNKFEIVLAGQSLYADKLTFKQAKRSDGQQYVSMLMQGGSIKLGEGLANIDNLNGTLLIGPEGVTGKVEVDAVSLNLGVASISSRSISLTINTGAVPAVLDSVDSGGKTIRINSGPFFRFSVSSGSLSVADQTIDADFFIEKQSNSGGEERLTVVIQNAVISMGSISMTGGSGTFLAIPDSSESKKDGGIVGEMSVSVDVGNSFDGFDLSGQFKVRFNDTGSRILKPLKLILGDVILDVPKGPYFQLGVTQGNLTVLGQSLAGNFYIEEGSRGLILAASEASIKLGDGNKDYLVLNKGSGAFVIDEGVAGEVSGEVLIQNVPGIDFDGTLSLVINTTNQIVSRTFNLGGEEKSLNIQAGEFVRFIASNASLSVGGQSIEAESFYFERSQSESSGNDPPTTLIIAKGTGIGLFLGDDGGTPDQLDVSDDSGVRLENGAIDLIISDEGIAAVASGSVSIRFSNDLIQTTASVKINNTGKGYSYNLGSGTNLNVEAGNYFKLDVQSLNMTLLGQTLSGNFSFEQINEAGYDGQFNTSDDRKLVR